MIDGGDGDDLLFGDGTALDDYMFSSTKMVGGADTILGGSGNDEIYGDGQSDVVVKGGDDALFGDTGNDVLYGDGIGSAIAGGADHITGGDGADVIAGDGIAADNRFEGSGMVGGDDWIDGGDGADLLYGDGRATYSYGFGSGPTFTGGNDTILAGQGDDEIYGDGLVDGTNDAEFYGGSDRIDGGSGDDTIYGDAIVNASSIYRLQNGDDFIRGGTGRDTVWGDSMVDTGAAGSVRYGADTFAFTAGDGNDTIMDFRYRQGDRLRFEDFGTLTLDTNRNGLIDSGDAHASVGAGSLTIDIGAAGGAAAGVQTVTLSGLRSVSTGSVDFVGSGLAFGFVNTATDTLVSAVHQGDILDTTGIAPALRGFTAAYVGDGDPNDDDGSILFELYDSAGALLKRQMESTAPFALFGDNGASGFLNASPALSDGTYQLKATAYAGNNGLGTVLASETIGFTFRSTTVSVSDFVVSLVDTGTEQTVGSLFDGASLDVGELATGRRGIAATFLGDGDSQNDDGSLVFELRDDDGTLVRRQVESTAPFALFGDNGAGNFRDSVPPLPDGEYSLTLLAYSGDNASGTLLGSEVMDFILT